MRILKTDLEAAAKRGIISYDQASNLQRFLESERLDAPKFHLLDVSYYLGALIVIAAMTWFLSEAWQQYGGSAILVTSLAYATVFSTIGCRLWQKKDLKIPAGLLVTVAVCMAPLAIYGFQKMTGLWPQGDPGLYRGYHLWVKGSWFFLELGTVIASVVALKFISFPFLTAPAAFSLWYMSMDLTPLLFGKETFSFEEQKWVSCIFGLVILAVTYAIDLKRRKQDFAFWGYLFGIVALWGGLSTMNSDSELNKFLYCMINVAMIFGSVFFRRKVFMVFGAIGVFGYIGHLSYQVFKDSLLFPIVLSGLGVLIIYLGIWYKQNQIRSDKLLLRFIPNELKKLRPPER